MTIIGRFAVRFRYPIIALWVLAALLCIHSFPSLSSVVNPDNSSFLPSSSPSHHAAEMAGPFQPTTGTTALLVATRAGGPLTQADQSAISGLESEAGKIAHVTFVHDQGISADGHARKALIAVDVQPSSAAAGQVVDTMRADAAHDARSGLAVHLTGTLAAGVDNQRASDQAQRTTQLLSDLVILLMLVIVFRAALAPLLTLLPAVLVLLMSGPVIAEASTVGVQVSSVTQIILTTLLLGAGTDYGLFLTLRVREELRRGLAPHDAVIRAVGRVGESITFSGGTVIGALLCLLLASFGLYHGLGPALAIGIAMMLLAALTLLPALLAVGGRVAFWPANVAPGPERPGAWGRLAGYIVERPVMTLAAGAVLFGGLAALALGFAPAGFGGSTTGPGGSDSAAGTAAIVAHYPAAVANPTGVLMQFRSSVWTNLATVQQAEQGLSAHGDVFSSVSGLLDPNGTAIQPEQLASLYQQLGPPNALPVVRPASIPLPTATYNAYRATAQFVSPDGRTVQFYTSLKAGDPAGAAALQAMPAVRRAASGVARAAGAADSGVAGQAAVAYDVSAASNDDLDHIVPLVMLLIAILLGVVMRSLVAPLYLVASVALSYFASLGVAVLIFMRAQDDAGLNFVLPFLMFVFLMALGEDYNILVMSRIREEAQRASLHDAIARALNATGTTVTSAGLILASTFGVAGLFGSTDQIRQLGVAIAAGVLMDTFLVRTLLVPSVVVLLGRWNWWPSRLGRRPRQVYQPELLETAAS